MVFGGLSHAHAAHVHARLDETDGAGLELASYKNVFSENHLWETTMSLGTILLIILILILVGALPTWPYSSGWGYYPSGGLGLIVIILLILILMGRL
jgi:hypothetical protein